MNKTQHKSSDVKILQEIKKCKTDFIYFANTYLKIVTKDGQLITLHLNDAQEAIYRRVIDNPHLMVLKARQLGSSTVIAAYFFWLACFNVNKRIAVVAHTGDAVKNIFRIYQCFLNNLPKFIKFPVNNSNTNEIVFKHGSRIRVGSSKTESFRGATYDCIHASEYAFWSDIKAAIASLFQTAQGASTIILESTPNGLNEAYSLWNEQSGFDRLFLGWQMDPEYVSEIEPIQLTLHERKYIKDNNIPRIQANWIVNTLRINCANNWNTLNQEYPINATVAFVMSGARVFNCVFPATKWQPGSLEWEKPKKYHPYLIGVDVASGSPGGDFSAFVILDINDKKDIKTVGSYYGRETPATMFKTLLAAAKKYNAFIVVESNTYGLSILERLREAEWPYIYRRVKYDKISKRHTENLGFATTGHSRPLLMSKLEEYINNGWLEPHCPRLKNEINTFIYNENGKQGHEVGAHDDMIFAHALALMGLDQVQEYKEAVKKAVKPTTISEILQWECATGELYKNHGEEEFWDQEESPLQGFDPHE